MSKKLEDSLQECLEYKAKLEEDYKNLDIRYFPFVENYFDERDNILLELKAVNEEIAMYEYYIALGFTTDYEVNIHEGIEPSYY